MNSSIFSEAQEQPEEDTEVGKMAGDYAKQRGLFRIKEGGNNVVLKD